MSSSELTPIVEDRLWSVERPVWFSGVRQRVRTTIVRLEDGGLLIHSPAPPSGPWAEQLQALGEVRWLLVPNCFHHLGTPAAAARWPNAKVIGPASATRRNKDLVLHLDLADPQVAELLPELELLPLDGVPFLDETVLYHRPTQTLIGTDIVLCACARDHWTVRWAARLTGFYERVRVPPDVRAKIPDKAGAARSIRAMLERPARRLIVGHADVIDDRCHEHLAAAWRLEGVEV